MPEEPVSDPGPTTSEEDLSEALDEDKLPADFPPDRPVASFDYGVTPQEERVDEPLRERVKREIPDPLAQVLDGKEVPPPDEGVVGHLVAPDEGVHDDVEGAEVATAVEPVPRDNLPVGDVGTADTTTYDVVTERTQDLSAEEAAVHEREVP